MANHTQKILVVEDCPSDISLLERLLADGDKEHRLELVCAPRLIDAFRRIDEEQFDVILLDLNLLDMDGVASVAALAAETPGTPIIVYSGMEDRKTREKALLCGAREYLVKGQENGRSLQLAIRNAIACQPQYRHGGLHHAIVSAQA